jgi:hypothetical protein
MLALLQAFFEILICRRGPEDLPDSPFLLEMMIIAYMLAQTLVVIILYGRWSEVELLAILVDTAVLALFFWLLLKFTQRAGRYRRTLTALFGTGALLALPQAPLVFFSEAASTAGQSAVGPALCLLAVLFWSIVVQAHIASRALSSNIGVGLAVALAYFLLSYQVSGQFPQATR